MLIVTTSVLWGMAIVPKKSGAGGGDSHSPGETGQKKEVKAMGNHTVSILLVALFVCSPFAGAEDGKEKAHTNSIAMELVPIPAGSFMMGSPESEQGRDDDETRHKVVISKPFLIGKYEVTQKQWQQAMESNPSIDKECGDGCPVEKVTWYDAVKFCNALSKIEGLTPAYRINATLVIWDREATGYRLPTEAEWEYACRAGTTTTYHSGDSEKDLHRAGWYNKNADNKTHPVGEKVPNAWGLYDMHGNVMEWCWDRFDKTDYAPAEATDPIGSPSGAHRIIRGGGWYFGYARHCRSANRGEGNPDSRNSNLGLRVVRPKSELIHRLSAGEN